MLEKIGLPPKPSLRGNTWVVDASHCQGCGSQFTFINRKHHCRRCGGIFCGSCTQQRMVLRGQGDSPVRICEPCKKLEEAARFEMRHGYKNRAAKGSSKFSSTRDDDNGDKLLSKLTGSASSSNIQQADSPMEEHDLVRNLSLDQSTNLSSEIESATPEELREQALAEKKKYKTLKAEGKSGEALRAFKRGKELERQAGALEISLRKSRKKALSSSNLDDAKRMKDQDGASVQKKKLSTEKSEGKDDLSDELKQLGWSDADLHAAEKRPATSTVEGELSLLLREVSQKPPGKEKQSTSIDKSQVIGHKKKALELKRAGNLAEAKEELKKAKILEKKIEEEELLGGSDESEDERSSLMRNLESGEHDDLSSTYKTDITFDFNQIVGIAGDPDADGIFEVTDEDMADPELTSALRSLGWDEDFAGYEAFQSTTVSSSSRESLLSEIQSLKKEAVKQKRAGNTSEAMALLKKAKALEMDLPAYDAQESDFEVKDSAAVLKPPVYQSMEDNIGGPILAPKSKLTIQKELLAMKKKALTLRREGRVDESEEELRKAKVLEQQLEEMNQAPMVAPPSTRIGPTSTAVDVAITDGDEEDVTDQDLNDPTYLSLLKNLGWDDEYNAKVISSTSKENDKAPSLTSKDNVDSSIMQSTFKREAGTSRKSRSEIQRELLALKRKALTLRRQGETVAADEMLENAKSLEAQLQACDEPTQKWVPSETGGGNMSNGAPQKSEPSLQMDMLESGAGNSRDQESGDLVRSEDISVNDRSVIGENSLQVDLLENVVGNSRNQEKIKLENSEDKLSGGHRLYIQEQDSTKATESQPHSGPLQQETLPDGHETSSSMITENQPQSNSLLQEIMAHKRKAVALKREGKLAEAKEELRLAKLLEKRMEGMSPISSPSPAPRRPVSDTSTDKKESSPSPAPKRAVSDVSSPDKKDISPNPAPKLLTSRERFKLQQESLAHKRQALKFRREGKTAEADAEFELAKSIEAQLQESDNNAAGSSKAADHEDVSVEDFLDPQLLSALQSVGIEGLGATPQVMERPEAAKSSASNADDTEIERKQLAERIKAEKLKAVNLKRSGKPAEAMDALRRAKLYEKKLQSLNLN